MGSAGVVGGVGGGSYVKGGGRVRLGVSMGGGGGVLGRLGGLRCSLDN